MKKKTISFFLVMSVLLSGCQPFHFKMQNDEGPSAAAKDNDKTSSAAEDGIEMDDREDISVKDETRQASSESGLSLPSDNFNTVIEADGKRLIQNPDNIMALVNKEFTLPESYIPADLVRPSIPFSFGDQQEEKALLRNEAAMALEKLFREAGQAGIELFAVSGYRSYNRQHAIFEAEVEQKGQAKAVEAVANPGQSEHQTGLAIDISSRSNQLLLTQQFEMTLEGKWLKENAHKYGFILRYPKGKESVTGYKYEPWHFRYVGVEAAAVIFDGDLTLEEYFNIVEKI
ncbi:D-alanyl-D-alanine carboxypeptidase family protein [Peribacillus saganii]|uniref:D-alanyl-D-alanine carboxypeptidase family protein n=1 Tax=Peribacillus saganii TaxID=2303992 RepID=A0A372LK83_9BACI|nr:M15 family metallopeptidase [Peribacillus saganii]RFU66436.1 D-alanyl-D-alanine carboxypeptidase family protein [Peribacillus saganii]